MKRGRESMEHPPARRQEPVSCQFCRAKKLRCSRESPCSNCAVRGITCVSASGTHPNARPPPLPLPRVLQHVAGEHSNELTLHRLHRRVLRIEHALSITGADVDTQPKPGPSEGAPAYSNPQKLSASELGGDAALRPPAAKATAWTNPDNALSRAAKESIDIEDEEVIARFARSGFHFQPGINASQFLQVWPLDPEAYWTPSQWQESFPTYERAVQLLDLYTYNVCWTYHFVHIPTLRRQLKETYDRFETRTPQELSIMALLSVIFALAKYFSRSTQISEPTGMSNEKGYGEYVSLASRALAEARHLDNPTIESIQAVLLLASSLLLNMGAMAAFRVLLTAMFISAQTLLIHQVDSPKNQKLRQGTHYNRVELEIKRRIWWHICSSDWIFAFISGTQTESSVVHSRRMHVNHPSNADDAAITPDHCPDEPLFVPTEMTYFILRCRISVIFHEFMEQAADNGLGQDEVAYDDILEFDRKIHAFNDTVPYFLRTNPENRQRCVELDRQRPYLVSQRIMAQFSATTQMSGLHRPYIARGARDPKYAYSRMVCLRSARMVLECERTMRTEVSDTATMTDPSKIWAMMYQVFLATVVLVMDYNFNKDEPCAEERVAEIMDCCRRLEAAKEVSAVAARGLEELKRVVRKWGLLTDVCSKNSSDKRESDGSIVGVSEPKTMEIGNIIEQEVLPASGGEFATSWIESWDLDVELNEPQWNALFQDLESRSYLF